MIWAHVDNIKAQMSVQNFTGSLKMDIAWVQCGLKWAICGPCMGTMWVRAKPWM